MSHLETTFEVLWDNLYPDINLYTQQIILKAINPDTGKPYRYRYDYVNFDSKVAIEINGQIWVKGGHNTGNGLLRDYAKSNLAIAEGWVVFALAEEMITDYWLGIIAKAIRERCKI